MIKKWEIPKSEPKKKKGKDTREGYYKYIDKLNKVIPDDDLRELGRNFGTTRTEVDWNNICRVVPSDWWRNPELLSMPKDNKILPELKVKEVYHELLTKLIKKKVV